MAVVMGDSGWTYGVEEAGGPCSRPLARALLLGAETFRMTSYQQWDRRERPGERS